MRVRNLGLLITLAACGSTTARPTPPAAPVVAATPAPPIVAPVVVAPVVVEEDPIPEWKPHRCKKSVWPEYESYRDDDPSEEVSTYEPELEPGGGGDSGRTLDEKTRERDKTRPREGVCDVRIREDLEAGILRAPTPRPATSRRAGWDHRSPPGFRDLVRGGLALDAAEEQQLAQNGFVVPARLAYDNYTSAYSDIHRGELPVYVSADSILHAVYASHDQLVASLERQKLLKHLDAALGAMHCGLAAEAKVLPDDVASDLDLYLTVARTLLATSRNDSCCDEVPSELGKVDVAAQRLVRKILAAGPKTEVELFGRVRSFDASMYTPRGHYANDADLERYFRAAMWLSRTEFNLVSRDSRSSQPGNIPDPRETPREALDALALAELADRSHASADLAAIDRAWTAFAGKREDVPFAELARLRAKAKITNLADPDAAARLRAAIGDTYQRTVNVHPMPNVAQLPAIATMIGPRITPDTVALGTVIHDRGPDLQAAEVGYMLGQDRALAYVATTPEVMARLHDARDQLTHAPVGADLYGAWLAAIRGLAITPAGARPTFMATEPFQDLRLDSALAAYGQLRHNHVLIAAQVYDQSGCDIPDGYVEPALDTYVALADYAARGKAVFAALDPADKTHGKTYFTRLERLLRVLVALAREELADRPLSGEAKRFLGDIVEMRESSAWDYNGSFPIATYDGWYLDLFPFQDVAFKEAAFIADYATFDTNGHQGIHYVGAKGPRLGVFVVDTGGPPRLMVGPVARAYQHTGALDHRLDDAGAASVAGASPWAASYTATAPAEPTIAVELSIPRPTRPGDETGLGRHRPKTTIAANVLHIESANELGDVAIELLDHHFVALRTITVHLAKGATDTTLPTLGRAIESIQLHVGAFVGRMDLGLDGHGRKAWGAP